MTREEILRLPKAELHCHLDGSLSLGLISELLGREVSREEVCASRDCRDLREYLEKFSIPLSCLQSREGLRRGAADFVRQLSSDGVAYAEVRFAPQFSTEGGLSVPQVIEAVLEGLSEGGRETGVFCAVIVCAMRHLPEEENLSMLRAAREYLGEGVVAADLAGDEAAYPMERFCGLFEEARRMGMPFTLHAGECGRAENVRLSLDCGARRIGHGIAMRSAPDLIERCKRDGIGIELCPTSNLQTRASAEGDYPLRAFLDAGLLVTVNTDNRTVSGTTLTDELLLCQELFCISDEEVRLLCRNAAAAAFTGDGVRERLQRAMM